MAMMLVDHAIQLIMAYDNTNPDDEDFKSRYGYGMPTALADAATQSLATEDVSLGKVNAAGRLAALPGVGAPGSNASTDQTNLNVAAAMDRADIGNRFGFGSTQYQQGTVATTAPTLADTHVDDITQRRADNAQQRTELMARLGMVPPSAAGLAAVVLPSEQRGPHGQPSQADKLRGQLALLEKEDRNLLQEHQDVAIDQARTAHENLVRNTTISSANGKQKILSGLADIASQYPIGSPQYHIAALRLLGSDDPDIAVARGTSGFESLLKPHLNIHDNSATSAERIKQALDNYTSATGMKPQSVELTSKGDVNIRSGSTRPVAQPKKTALQGIVEKDLAASGVSPEDFVSRTNVRRGRVKDNGDFTNQYSNAANGSTVAFDVGGQTFTMPVSKFQRADKFHPIGTQGAQSTAVDVKALAQKALIDPNASEEHKAAARRILGQ